MHCTEAAPSRQSLTWRCLKIPGHLSGLLRGNVGIPNARTTVGFSIVFEGASSFALSCVGSIVEATHMFRVKVSAR